MKKLAYITTLAAVIAVFSFWAFTDSQNFATGKIAIALFSLSLICFGYSQSRQSTWVQRALTLVASWVGAQIGLLTYGVLHQAQQNGLEGLKSLADPSLYLANMIFACIFLIPILLGAICERVAQWLFSVPTTQST